MRYLKDEETANFLKAAKAYCNTKGTDSRPNLIAHLMISSGLRVSEVVGEHYDYYIYTIGKNKGNVVSPKPTEAEATRKKYKHIKNVINGLYIEDIDFDKNTITLFGAKGNKDRVVPFTDDCKKVILDYLVETGRTPKSLGQLVETSVDTVQRWFKDCSDEAKIRKVNPHMLRHTFSVRFLQEGGDIRVLQKILGHSSLSVTEKYLSYVFGDIEDGYKKVMNEIQKKRGR